jgi:hypothetical protein
MTDTESLSGYEHGGFDPRHRVDCDCGGEMVKSAVKSRAHLFMAEDAIFKLEESLASAKESLRCAFVALDDDAGIEHPSGREAEVRADERAKWAKALREGAGSLYDGATEDLWASRIERNDLEEP